MAKTLTVSDEAYNVLARLKLRDESFSKIILRLAGRKEKGSLIDYVRSLPPDPKLAAKLDKVLEKRGQNRLRASQKGKKFKTSLTGFRYSEGIHEASRFLFKKN